MKKAVYWIIILLCSIAAIVGVFYTMIIFIAEFLKQPYAHLENIGYIMGFMCALGCEVVLTIISVKNISESIKSKN